MKRLAALVLIVFPLLLFILLGCTQTSEELKSLEKKIEALKEGQESIKKDLQEVKKVLQTIISPRRVEFTETTINIDADPFKGEKIAKVTLIDFSDYE